MNIIMVNFVLSLSSVLFFSLSFYFVIYRYISVTYRYNTIKVVSNSLLNN